MEERKKFPTNHDEYLSSSPEQDGFEEYGEEQANQPSIEQMREDVKTLKQIRDLLRRPYDPS